MSSPFSSRRGSAMLVAMWIMILMTLIASVFLDRVWRFHRDTENIEQSNVAYYHTMSAIERALYSTDQYAPWKIQMSNSGNTLLGYGGSALTGGTMIPIGGNGNSPYDPDWNIIDMSHPVQIVIPNGVNWTNTKLYFRVPNLDGNTSTTENIDATFSSNSGVINWIIASTGQVLFASGELQTLRKGEISSSNGSIIADSLSSKVGNTASGSTNVTFANFYTLVQYLGSNGAKCANFSCTLKLSLLREVPVTSGGNTKDLPFLEYKIDFGSTRVPSQYMILSTQGMANGYLRSRTILLPQITTNSALDFGVLQ